MPKTSAAPSGTEQPGTAGKNKMYKISTYHVDGRKFIVTPVFPEEGRESFGTILMRLMKSEVASQL